jgi:AraC-like DNA-binding protein
VRVASVLPVPAVLRSLGANPADLLAEVGFDLKLLDDPDARVSYTARNRLIAHCAARTNCTHFGLLVGQRIGLHTLGLVGLLVKYSPDVGTALRSLVRYTPLHVRGAVTTLEVRDNVTILAYRSYQPRVAATDLVADASVAMLFNAMRELCGSEWKPIEVRFAHRKPADPGPFRRFFRAPLQFDAEESAVVFSADWMDHPLAGDDPELRRLLHKQIDAIEARHGDSFPDQVRSVLRMTIVTGNHKADRVAALFSMHRCALARRLKAFGVGFQDLVDETRYEIARQMLKDSAMPVSQIAAMLGYANASAFTRAFGRWSGTTPARWRATRGRAD